jgi:hypothetical protein
MSAELLTGFDCRVCGLHHDVLPLSYSVKYPLASGAVPAAELESRVVLTADLCVIDERFHYVRGRFAIPIHGLDEPFIWGCWSRISAADFFRTHQLWKDPARESEPPYHGLLNSELPLYGDTRELPVQVQTMPVGRRPHFTPADPRHPLAVEQRQGMTMERVIQIAEQMLHSPSF